MSGALPQRADGSEIESIEAFERQIATAQAELATSIERAGLRRDVLRHPIEAIGTVIGTLSGFVRLIDDRIGPRPELQLDEEAVRQIGRMVAFTTERIAGEQLRAQRRGQAITLVGILLAAMVISAGLAFWGGSSWRGARMMDDCRAHQSADPSGRRGCVIWLDPQK
ncbi:MAG: hypothetical protein J0H99_09055 [Rhodospirillales bacterium]|nr:hypothetical protein [Rhodospirillales bacterium]